MERGAAQLWQVPSMAHGLEGNLQESDLLNENLGFYYQ